MVVLAFLAFACLLKLRPKMFITFAGLRHKYVKPFLTVVFASTNSSFSTFRFTKHSANVSSLLIFLQLVNVDSFCLSILDGQIQGWRKDRYSEAEFYCCSSKSQRTYL